MATAPSKQDDAPRTEDDIPAAADEPGPHDVPDEEVIDKTLPSKRDDTTRPR
jgi:hypothetical protein